MTLPGMSGRYLLRTPGTCSPDHIRASCINEADSVRHRGATVR